MKKVIFSLALFTVFGLQGMAQNAANNTTPASNPNAGDFSFPVYWFRPFGKHPFVMAGLNYEFRLKGKKRTKSLSL
ncbi:MAG TPA: hypothetical protein PLZ10_08880, partial [Chitinophagaceae bacterium]|nr:hypothetical protein [Chitinophagaceae bacterium]